MNINMIRGLAEQHKNLKAFLAVCNHNGVELEIQETEKSFGNVTLDYCTTALILPDIRGALLQRIKESEESIQRLAGG